MPHTTGSGPAGVVRPVAFLFVHTSTYIVLGVRSIPGPFPAGVFARGISHGVLHAGGLRQTGKSTQWSSNLVGKLLGRRQCFLESCLVLYKIPADLYYTSQGVHVRLRQAGGDRG